MTHLLCQVVRNIVIVTPRMAYIPPLQGTTNAATLDTEITTCGMLLPCCYLVVTFSTVNDATMREQTAKLWR